MTNADDDRTLDRYLIETAARTPRAVAIEELDGTTMTYGDLDNLSDRVRDELLRSGVRRGDRVALCLPKTADAIAIVHGILKAGAAYVALDPHAPPARNALILEDCAPRLLFVDPDRESALLASAKHVPERIRLAGGGGRGLEAALSARPPVSSGASGFEPPRPDDLAYLFYTSGSSGRPKGVCLTHRNGTSFVEWASGVMAPTPEDRFSFHVPLHFDPSTSDLYVPVRHGATVVLIDGPTGRDPFTLGELIARRRLTIWTSVTSVLVLLAQHGRLDRYDLSALRLVQWGGEVFPVKHLRRLRELVPSARMYNLYGPTETNVCTFFQIPARILPERVEPYPIGRPCAHLEARVTDPDGAEVEPGVDGELWISGSNVMRGYWNLPERTEAAFRDHDGRRWYRTGDIVREVDGELVFLGRRDRMVKRHGYRIELGEIEVALQRNPEFTDSAVIARPEEDGTRIYAIYVTEDGRPLPAVALKAFAMETLPRYMVPDRFVHMPSIPRTSTGKTDFQRIRELV
jgi:amino acid adenylation domain-containing protein